MFNVHNKKQIIVYGYQKRLSHSRLPSEIQVDFELDFDHFKSYS